MGKYIDAKGLKTSNAHLSMAASVFSEHKTVETMKALMEAIERSIKEDTIWLIPYSDVDCGCGSFWDKKNGPESGKWYYKLLINSKGTHVMPIFTDNDEVMSGPETDVIALRAKSILLEFCISPYAEDLTINPWSSNAIITKELIQFALSNCGIDWQNY